MSGSTRRLPWLNRWGWPFVWILLIPIATVLWTSVLLDQAVDKGNCTFVEVPFGEERLWDTWRCPQGDVLPTLLPGLLNLVAFAWLLSGQWEVRWAALLAGALGAVRLAVPMVAMLPDANLEMYGVWWKFSLAGGFSLPLWVLSAVLACVFQGKAATFETLGLRAALRGLWNFFSFVRIP